MSISSGIAKFACCAFVLNLSASNPAEARQAPDPMVPYFKADPYWPKPLPNHWLLGNAVGVDVDPHDNVWIVHRPQTLEFMESYRTRGESDCCTAAPDVLEFNPAGDVIRSWGKAEGHDWPTSNHGITIDKDGNVWLGGNGAGQPGPAPGSAAQFHGRVAVTAPIVAGEGGEAGLYHDSFILKMSPDGKFLGEIGHANGSKGSLDTENVKGVAAIRFLPGNELVAADGYGNHRVSVWDATTLKFKRMWGAYGHQPSDETIAPYNPKSAQFSNPVHCAEPTNDGLLYVCDRMNDRVQIFKFDGTFVREFSIEPNSKGDGTPWGIEFSQDPQQTFMYIIDGTDEKIHVYNRQTEKELYAFGGGGRLSGQFYAVHNIAMDSKGNIYTTETYRGQRLQKFDYKGMIRLSKLRQMRAIGNSLIDP